MNFLSMLLIIATLKKLRVHVEPQQDELAEGNLKSHCLVAVYVSCLSTRLTHNLVK